MTSEISDEHCSIMVSQNGPCPLCGHGFEAGESGFPMEPEKMDVKDVHHICVVPTDTDTWLFVHKRHVPGECSSCGQTIGDEGVDA